MKNGWIKVAAGTPRVQIADPAYNAEQIAGLMQQADQAGVQLLVLPELCVTAASCGDLFLQGTLLEKARKAAEEVIEYSSAFDMVTVLGLPLAWNGAIYDCALVLQKGKVLGIVPKTCLNAEERRWYKPAPADSTMIDWNGEKVPFGAQLLFQHQEIAEFTFGVCTGSDLTGLTGTAASLACAGATILVSGYEETEALGRAKQRRAALQAESKRLLAGFVVSGAGAGESTTDQADAGHRLILERGQILEESPLFTKGLTISELDVQQLISDRRACELWNPAQQSACIVAFTTPVHVTELTRSVDPYPFLPAEEELETALDLQAEGLGKRFVHAHCKTMIVGLSGGLDSTLALLACVRTADRFAISHTQILAVTMPCFGTTSRTRSNAEILAEALGVRFATIDMKASVLQHFADIRQDPEKYDVTFENAQARERTQILMDLANQENGLVVGTGDLSELALGWATYNGDHMSMYGVNAGIPKTLIRRLTAYIAARSDNDTLRDVLNDILATPVSPELLPSEGKDSSQKTEDLVGPYDLHDFFLYHIVRDRKTPSKVLRLAERAFQDVFPREVILHWLRKFCDRFFMQQYKRSALPDGPMVTEVSLSPRGAWHMPSDAEVAAWREDLE
ncbi:MAG: NAD(+) synthase [Clostridiales bacterium]|nr:NAD(+) synthase [Clostridiales bacterium]